MERLLRKPLKLIFPDQCVVCRSLIEEPQGLCAACWRDTPFLSGALCDCCGAPLLGRAVGGRELCDSCIEHPPPWTRGRSALKYEDRSRSLVLSFKNRDRLDLAKPLGRWMARAGEGLRGGDPVLVPVPLHWTRLCVRRFNQSAILAQVIATDWGADVIPDALVRTRRTRRHEAMSYEERAANIEGAIAPNPKRAPRLAGRSVVLVDDVLTSGATLRAATEAAHQGGADEVSVLTLARVVKD